MQSGHCLEEGTAGFSRGTSKALLGVCEIVRKSILELTSISHAAVSVLSCSQTERLE